MAAGACTVEDVANACGAATDCGSCRLVVEDLVAEASGATLADATR